LAKTLWSTPGRVRREAWAPLLYHAVEGVSSVPSSGSLYEGYPQGGESRHNLRARPFRPVTDALARGAGLLQPFGLLFEPRDSLQVRGVGIEVFVYGPRHTRRQDRGFLNRSATAPSPTIQASQRLL
jgi:hypothetical protein